MTQPVQTVETYPFKITFAVENTDQESQNMSMLQKVDFRHAAPPGHRGVPIEVFP